MQTDSATVLGGRQIGLEKESLRVSASGSISQVDHPRALGCALTHPFITTDFSEALLEMVTPPCDSAAATIDFLLGLHHYIVDRLPEGEHIWNTSMPCILHGGDSVRIGQYGSSFSGQMKHAYRRGLALRYGRRMQAIAGIHFNYSFPDAAWLVHARASANTAEDLRSVSLDERWKNLSSAEQMKLRTNGYFATMQNLLRVGWLVPYLFGASPAICKSYLAKNEGEELAVWNDTTRYAPYGTSLRMGKIGYRYSEDQPIDLSVRHTSVDAYIEDIIAHVSTKHPPYDKMGLHDANGRRHQLSTSRLQIENEFYGSVRPKQIPDRGQLPILALRERGIRYLELRSVDVNMIKPAGLDLDDVLMLEMLMIFAWLSPTSSLSDREMSDSTENIQIVAHRGREPGLVLSGPSGDVNLQTWGIAVFDVLTPIAQWLDQDADEPSYSRCVTNFRAMLEDPDNTPSARILKGIKSTGSFFEHAQTLSLQHHDYLANLPENLQFEQMLEQHRKESYNRQDAMEQASVGDFATFLADYLNQINTDKVAKR